MCLFGASDGGQWSKAPNKHAGPLRLIYIFFLLSCPLRSSSVFGWRGDLTACVRSEGVRCSKAVTFEQCWPTEGAQQRLELVQNCRTSVSNRSSSVVADSCQLSAAAATQRCDAFAAFTHQNKPPVLVHTGVQFSAIVSMCAGGSHTLMCAPQCVGASSLSLDACLCAHV